MSESRCPGQLVHHGRNASTSETERATRSSTLPIAVITACELISVNSTLRLLHKKTCELRFKYFRFAFGTDNFRMLRPFSDWHPCWILPWSGRADDHCQER